MIPILRVFCLIDILIIIYSVMISISLMSVLFRYSLLPYYTVYFHFPFPLPISPFPFPISPFPVPGFYHYPSVPDPVESPLQYTGIIFKIGSLHLPHSFI